MKTLVCIMHSYCSIYIIHCNVGACTSCPIQTVHKPRPFDERQPLRIFTTGGAFAEALDDMCIYPPSDMNERRQDARRDAR